MNMLRRRFHELSPREKWGQVLFWLIVLTASSVLFILLAFRGFGIVADCALGWISNDQRWFNKLDRLRW